METLNFHLSMLLKNKSIEFRNVAVTQRYRQPEDSVIVWHTITIQENYILFEIYTKFPSNGRESGKTYKLCPNTNLKNLLDFIRTEKHKISFYDCEFREKFKVLE